MLAYLFWHWPAPQVDRGAYEAALVAFHRALAAAPPPGFLASRVLEVEGAPWAPVPRVFEDWYLVEDFAALGALNDAAVSGSRKEPHDGAARLAAGGAGGVYRRLGPEASASSSRAPLSSSRSGGTSGAIDRVSWMSKPPRTSYPEFLARLPDAETWQRQLVLGPAPEFCLVGSGAPAGSGAVTLAVRSVHGAASAVR